MSDEKQSQAKGESPAAGAPAGKPRADAGEKRAVEHWAEKHGMLPEVFEGGALQLPPEARAQRSARVSMAMSGKVAPRGNPRHVHFKAARLYHGWPTGHECTEAEFLAACRKAYGPDSEVVCR